MILMKAEYCFTGGIRRSVWPPKKHTVMNGSLQHHQFVLWRRHRHHRRHRYRHQILIVRRWVPAVAVSHLRPAKYPFRNPRKSPNHSRSHTSINNNSNNNSNNNNKTKLVNANELMATRISTIRALSSLPSSETQRFQWNIDQRPNQIDQFHHDWNWIND